MFSVCNYYLDLTSYFYLFCYFLHIAVFLFLLKTFKALNGLLCADVPLRNYSLTVITICYVLTAASFIFESMLRPSTLEHSLRQLHIPAHDLMVRR